MRVYLSGAITGTDDYMERFARAQMLLQNEGHSVINPALVNSNMPSDTPYEEYMNRSFAMLSMCDAIYMLEGCQKSCVANIEYVYVYANSMIIFLEDSINEHEKRV